MLAWSSKARRKGLGKYAACSSSEYIVSIRSSVASNLLPVWFGLSIPTSQRLPVAVAALSGDVDMPQGYGTKLQFCDLMGCSVVRGYGYKVSIYCQPKAS